VVDVPIESQIIRQDAGFKFIEENDFDDVFIPCLLERDRASALAQTL
jgi:hypothetical protein